MRLIGKRILFLFQGDVEAKFPEVQISVSEFSAKLDEGYNKDLRYLMVTLNNCLNLNDFIIALTRKFQMESVNARLKK